MLQHWAFQQRLGPDIAGKNCDLWSTTFGVVSDRAHKVRRMLEEQTNLIDAIPMVEMLAFI
jgi:hypothetical protein